MYENGYLNIGAVEARATYYITTKQANAVKSYFLTGTDKPILMKIPNLTDDDSQAGRKPFSTNGYVLGSISASPSTIYLKAPFITTGDIDVGDSTITAVTSIEDRTIYAITR